MFRTREYETNHVNNIFFFVSRMPCEQGHETHSQLVPFDILATFRSLSRPPACKCFDLE